MAQDEKAARAWLRWPPWHRQEAAPAPAEPPLDEVTYEERRESFRRAVARLLVARGQARPGVPSDEGPYGQALDGLVLTFGQQALEDAVRGLAPSYDACTSDQQRAALLARYTRS